VRDGLGSVAKFIRNAANHIIMFAQLALKSVVSPLTNNLVKRLMGELLNVSNISGCIGVHMVLRIF